MAVGIDAGEDGDNVIRGVRDERRMVVAEQNAIVLDEVQQVGHLLEVRGYQRRAISCGVTLEVHVVEDDVTTCLMFPRGEFNAHAGPRAAAARRTLLVLRPPIHRPRPASPGTSPKILP